MNAVEIVFWVSAGLLIYAQVGYGALLWLLSLLLGGRRSPALGEADAGGAEQSLPRVSVIVAAYAEEAVIAARVANLRAQDYPGGRVQIVVACDGSPDETAARARAAGADLVLELPREGKVVTQDTAVRHATGAVLAFSDANVEWEPDALRRLVEAFVLGPKVGYACGDVTFTDAGGDNQEGLYWRYEMWLRGLESQLSSITAGNGAIYATRAETYFTIGPLAGHDLAFPLGMVKRGWRAVYVPAARASEKMAPSIEGEFARKRRMAKQTWPTVFDSGLLSPRGYGPLYALMILSHRVLRYISPFLHVLALATSLILVGSGLVYVAAAAIQLAVIAGALLAPVLPARLLLVARYYVMTTAALAVGLWDWLRGDRAPTWEAVAGTR